METRELKIMSVEELKPTANLDTIRDGRGGIFTFIPHDPIVEFNFNIIKAGKVRGNHFHPEFDEYLLLTSGEGVIVSINQETHKEDFIYLSKGQCTVTPKGTSHVFIAISDCEAIAMLTKKWDDCEKPIVHQNLGMGKGDHGDPESPYHKDV